VSDEPIEARRRAAAPGDREAARQLHHLAYRDVAERQFGRWDEAAQDGYFDTAWHDHAHDVLEWDGRVCGYIALEFTDDRVVVHELVVHPEYQGRGVGSNVLRAIIAEARGAGLPVTLQVLHENHRAAALYQRFGFQVYGATATHHQMRLGTIESRKD
jgi:ribosomal protein S18 acetylase RimI-like enzyme